MTSLFFIIYYLSFIFFFAGCAAQRRSCPPLKSETQAAAVLKEYAAGLKPLKATGSCNLNYTDEKGEKFAQSFPVRIWFESSKKFCLYGDLFFDPKAICFAVSGDEFWTYAKPFGIYITGKAGAETADCFSNPTMLVDFLEPLNSACSNISILSSNNKNNILVCQDGRDCKRKRIFIDRCERLVKKIEYFNCSGETALVIEPGEYKSVADEKNFLFPHKLIYRRFEGRKCKDWMQIKLDSIKIWQSRPEQIKALFSPPDVNSFQKSSELKEIR